MGRTSLSSLTLPPAALDRPDPLVALGDVDGSLDPTALFGQTGRIEVEVGFGKGRLLLDLATEQPTRLYLGIERALPYARLVRHHLLLREIENVRLLCSDAADVFHRLLPDSSIDAVNVLFPDPWPKRRHHKRRLLQPSFLSDIVRVMAPGGFLCIATDHDGYWTHIEPLVDAIPGIERQRTFRLGMDRLHETHFGARFGSVGVPFHAGTWRRSR